MSNMTPKMPSSRLKMPVLLIANVKATDPMLTPSPHDPNIYSQESLISLLNSSLANANLMLSMKLNSSVSH